MQTFNNITIFALFTASLAFCGVYSKRNWWRRDPRSGYLGRATMLTRALTAVFMGLLTFRRVADAPVTALWFLTAESTAATLWTLTMAWHTVILVKVGKWSARESNPSPREVPS